MIDHVEPSSPDTADLGIELQGDTFPEMPDLWQKIAAKPIPADTIAYLKQEFYPKFSDKEIALLERTIRYGYERITQHEQWGISESPYPSMADFAVLDSAPLEERMSVLTKLAKKAHAAFGSLQDIEQFLQLPGHPTLTEEIVSSADVNAGRMVVMDVGCGGQVADIQLLLNPGLRSKNISIVGIGAVDYGKNIRRAFPELEGKLEFRQQNAYTTSIRNEADLVFSARTLPYTGLIDAVRFCKTLNDMAKPDGAIWIYDVEERDFDFNGSGFSNLAEYLDSLKARFPSLSCQKKNSEAYSIFWRKKEGFPLERLKAKMIENSDQSQFSRPVLVRYGLE